MRHLLTIAGNRGSGTPTPSYSPLVAKLIEFGVTEIWLHDDASGGAVALFDSANDLLVTDDTGDNIVYEHQFSAFPNMKGIDLSDVSGETAYLSTASAVTDLHTTGSVSEVQIGIALADTNFNNAPFSGLASSGAGSDNNNLFCASYYLTGTSLNGRYMNEYASGSKNEIVNLVLGNNGYGSGAEFIAVQVRDGSTTKRAIYANGEERVPMGVSYAGKEPTDGANCKYVEGRCVTKLTTAARQPDIFGLRAYFKDKVLTASEIKEIMDAALNFQERLGEIPDSYSNAASWTANTLLDGKCLVSSGNTDVNTPLGASSNTVGLIAYVVQMGAGKSSYSASSGYNITGETSTLKQGDILRIECVADKEFVGTLYPS